MKSALVHLFAMVAGLGGVGLAPAWAADTPTHVGGVEVVAGPGPTVSSSFPANGASVAAGVVVLKIVFDQPVQSVSFPIPPAPRLDGGVEDAALDAQESPIDANLESAADADRIFDLAGAS